jgi:DNA-binding NarL/FixJ family response regulator
VARSDPKARTNEGGEAVVPILDVIRSELFALKQGVEGGSIAPTIIVSRLSDLVDRVQDAMSALSHLPDLTTEQRDVIRKQASISLLDALTPRERQVADAVLIHGTTARAAYALNMSEATLCHHRSNILRKLHAANFTQIARLFLNGAR